MLLTDEHTFRPTFGKPKYVVCVCVENETEEERPFDKLVGRQFFKLTLISLFPPGRDDDSGLRLTDFLTFSTFLDLKNLLNCTVSSLFLMMTQ